MLRRLHPYLLSLSLTCCAWGARAGHADVDVRADRDLEALLAEVEGARAYPEARFTDSLMVWGEEAEFLSDREQIVYFGRCLAIADSLGYRPIAIETMRELSSPYRHLDSIAKSYTLLHEAIRLARRYDTTALPRLTFKLGYNAYKFQDYGNAVTYLLESRHLKERAGRHDEVLFTTATLFNVYHEMGDRQRLRREADELLASALSRMPPEGSSGYAVRDSHLLLLGPAYNFAASAAAMTGDSARARALWEESFRIGADLSPSILTRVIFSRVTNGGEVYSTPELRANLEYARRLPNAGGLTEHPRFRLGVARILSREGEHARALAELASVRLADLELPTDRDLVFSLSEGSALALRDTARAYLLRVRLDSQRLARIEGRERAQLAYHEARIGREHLEEKLARSAAAEAASLREAALRRRHLWLSAALVGLLALVVVGIYLVYRREVALGRTLERTVDEKTADLSRRNAELARFNHVLAHDLKEPLRSIVSFSQLAARHNGDAAVGEYLQYATASARQLDQLVTGMLGFQADPETAYARAQLRELAEEALRDTRAAYPRKPIRLTAVDLPGALALPTGVLSESLRITLANAALFHDAPEVEVTLQYVRRGPYHVLTVTDNGIGIDAAYHETVFEIFKRLHVREAYPGAGIGLSRLRRILQAVGGHAKIISSAPGLGTTVAISWRDAGGWRPHRAADWGAYRRRAAPAPPTETRPSSRARSTA